MNDASFLSPVFKRWSKAAPLSQGDSQAIANLPWSHRIFGRDAYLAREGEPTKTCMLLVTGFAFRQKLVPTGARQIISIHIPGEFLDIQNCMLDVADHNVQTLNRSNVAIVPKGAISELIGDRPTVRRAIWLDSMLDASIFREWVVNVGRRDARTRIAHLLCELAARLKAAQGSDSEIYNFPLTQEQIADCTGLTAVHTNRTVQTLRRDGLINLTANKLTILDWNRLADVGDFNERYLHHGA